MRRRARNWLIGAAALVSLAAVLLEGELAILVANQRPGAEAARLIDQMRVADGDTIAEIGAGAGRLTVAVARALLSSRVYSTELGDERVAAIGEAVAEASLRNVDVREGALEGTNLPDGCCDAIFMRTVYHHFTAPPTMVAALERALKPGGRLAIIEFEPRGVFKWFAVPHDTPERGGHGVPKTMLRTEVTAAGGLRHVQTVDRWVGSLYLMLFEKNRG